jgi:hypothetical protein
VIPSPGKAVAFVAVHLCVLSGNEADRLLRAGTAAPRRRRPTSRRAPAGLIGPSDPRTPAPIVLRIRLTGWRHRRAHYLDV